MKIEDINYKKHIFETVDWFKNDGGITYRG